MATRYWLDADGDWNNTSNWSGGSVPTGSDDVFIMSGSQDIDTNLDQSAVTLASLTIGQGFTGTIGTTAADLQISATTCTIGTPDANPSATGSGRIRINFGSNQTEAIVLNTSSSSTDTGFEPVRLIGTHASNALYVTNGTVGTATTNPGEAATWSTVNTSNAASASPIVNLGFGCTLTTIEVGNGTVTNNDNNATTVTVQGAGTFLNLGSGTITTCTVGQLGTADLQSDGTITTLNVAGVADLANDPRAKTITNCNVYSAATLLADNGNPLSITFTNGIDLVQCGPQDVTLELGRNLTLSLSAI